MIVSSILIAPLFLFSVKVSDLLWNLYSYYKQFIPCVEQSLEEAKNPIEKELKVFLFVI